MCGPWKGSWRVVFLRVDDVQGQQFLEQCRLSHALLVLLQIPRNAGNLLIGNGRVTFWTAVHFPARRPYLSGPVWEVELAVAAGFVSPSDRISYRIEDQDGQPVPLGTFADKHGLLAPGLMSP